MRSPRCRRITWISAKKLDEIEANAKKLIDSDKKYAWRETLNIYGYSVFEDGVNIVPKLVNEIRKLRSALDAERPGPGQSPDATNHTERGD